MDNLIFFIGCFFSGLALNLTPCVYPMISVTVSIFRPDQGENTKSSFLKALVYVLGIVLMYSSLGVFAAMTGNLFGGILQNKWVLFLVGLLMGALALSMFGLYQLQPPAWLLQKLGHRRGFSYGSLFFSGMLVGVFAAPCIGPPIIALLTLVGGRGDPIFGFLAFFVLSLGLGLPYLILGTFSGLLKKLPKSGEWLIWVERIFGVVLLGLAAFYFCLALYPVGIHRIPPLTLIAGGIYLGFLEGWGRERKVWFLRVRAALGLIAVLVGSSILFSPSKEFLVWEPYRQETFAEAVKRNQPVVIDFYADWCLSCHELEQFVFPDPEVAGFLRSFTRIRVDATDMEDEEVGAFMEEFGVYGLPTIVFLDKDGVELRNQRVTGYVPAPEFAKILEDILGEEKGDPSDGQ